MIPPRATQWWHTEIDGYGRQIVVCTLCPRHCRIPPHARGFCFVRANQGGQLVLTTYGRCSSVAIDPIEKKPLNHFLPGTSVLSFGTIGCNLGCQFCQNWDISKDRELEFSTHAASPADLVAAAVARGCPSIAFTYNDPVTWAEYALDVAALAHEHGLKTVAVTAGYISPDARAEFFRHMDADNIDLKAFTEGFYRRLCLAQLQPVLDTLRYVARETRVWLEITNLVIPGANDDPDELRRLSAWVARELGPDVPVHFTAFHPAYKMLDTPATPPETLHRARRLAQQEGLRYVYTGNIHDPEGQRTYCPICGQVVVARRGYCIESLNLVAGACGSCGTKIPGVWTTNT